MIRHPINPNKRVLNRAAHYLTSWANSLKRSNFGDDSDVGRAALAEAETMRELASELRSIARNP